MARKDVNLVIRARDQASAALDRVSSALDEFKTSQLDLASNAGKVDKNFTDLTKAINKVETALGGLDNADRAAKQLESASAALASLKQESIEAAKTLSETRSEYRKSDRALKGYQNSLSNLEKSLAQTKARLKEASAAQAQATKATEGAQKAQAKLVARQAELPAILAKQNEALDKARDRWAKLKAQMDKGSPSATVQKDFASSNNRVNDLTTSIAELTAEYKGIGSAIKKAGKDVGTFAGAAKKAEKAVAQQASALDKAGQKYLELQDKIRRAETALRGLSSARGQGERGLKGLAADIDLAKQALGQLRESSNKAEAALTSLRGESISALQKQLSDQGKSASNAQLRYQSLRQEVARFSTAIGKLGVPTRAQAEQLDKLTRASNKAEVAFLIQRNSLQKVEKAFKDAGSDVGLLRNAMALFASEQTRVSSALSKLDRDAFKVSKSLRALRQAAAESSAKKLADDLRRAGQEAANAAPKITRLREVYNSLYGESRRALSINQRLRGEVLSLIASYGGFYGVIRTLGGVVDAYQEIEAAQARLNVANDGNIQQTAADLDYLRRTADRLGVDLGTLSREFSKFSIATQNTNLQGDRTRQIFESVAEAARVSRTSTEDMAGVFTALTQIVSKGAVQMEELRQQLGDRLPGAIQIMADGLGVTTGEMIKMMEQGQVTSDALVGFADQLKNRFGGGLEEALSSTSAELGRLKATTFQTMLAFGEAGFIESFNELLRSVIETMKSAEFRSFAERVSKGFAILTDAISVVVRNFKTFATVVGAAVGLKAFSAVNLLSGAFAGLPANIRKSIAVQRRYIAIQLASNAAGAAQIGIMGRLAVAMKALIVLTRTLVGATGVGLALVAVGAIVGNWLGSATDLNSVMENHVGIMDRVKNAYDKAGDSVEGWRKELKGLTETEAKESLRELERELRNLQGNLITANVGDGESLLAQLIPGGSLLTGASRDYNRAIDEILKKYRDGEIGAEKLRDEVDAINQTFDDGSEAHRRYANSLIEPIKNMVTVEAAIAEAKLVIATFGEDSDEAAAAMQELAGALSEAGGELEPIRTDGEAASKALEELNESSESLTKGLRGLLSQSEPLKEFFEGVEEQEAFEKMADDVYDAAMEILNLKGTWTQLNNTVQGISFTGLFVELLTDLDAVKGRLDGIGGALSGLGTKFGMLGSVLDTALGGTGNFLNAAMGNFTSNSDASIETAVNRIIFRESSARPGARADGKPQDAPFGTDMTAAGLGQFIADTWLRMFKQQFPEQAASMNREQILRLRFDPQLAYQMTTVAVQGYAKALESSGAPVNDTSLYLSHFLGQTEAVRLLKTSGTTPFSTFSPKAAKSNPTFANMTVQEVIGYFTTALRNVTPQQLAQVQQFNPDPVGAEAPETPEFEERNQALKTFNDELNTSVETQERLNAAQGNDAALAAVERKLAIEEAVADAREENAFLTQQEIDAIEAQAGALFDAEQAAERLKDAKSAREATETTLGDADFAVRQQELINQGLGRQAAIEEAIRSAKANDANISKEQLDLLAERTAALYDLQAIASGETEEILAAEKAEKRVNDLLEERGLLEERLALFRDRGQFSEAVEAEQQIKDLNTQLVEAIANATAMWQAVGGEDAALAVQNLENARLAAAGFAEQGFWSQIAWEGVADMLVNGLSGAFMSFAEKIAEGENAFTSARDAFRQFAADFLLQIAQMIIQAAILAALQAAFGGTAFGAAIGLVGAGTGHSGGIVGSGSVGSGRNLSRRVNPMVFANAPRFHGGGIVGLQPGEVPIIGKQGEEMLTQDDPRHSRNGGGNTDSAPPIINLKNINTFSPEEALEAALNSPVGERLFLNFVGRKSKKFKSAMES